MSFDDDVDKLKKKFLENRLEPEEIIVATREFKDRLEKEISSKRLKYEYEFDDEEGPRIVVLYAKAPFHIGTIFVQGSGAVGFASESEYFPPLIAYETKEEFFSEARQFLAEGLAAFELDEEEDAYEV